MSSIQKTRGLKYPRMSASQDKVINKRCLLKMKMFVALFLGDPRILEMEGVFDLAQLSQAAVFDLSA